MLLGSFLDWSLDYCSGYEGDQESEGEKDGDGECLGLQGRGVSRQAPFSPAGVRPHTGRQSPKNSIEGPSPWGGEMTCVQPQPGQC